MMADSPSTIRTRFGRLSRFKLQVSLTRAHGLRYSQARATQTGRETGVAFLARALAFWVVAIFAGPALALVEGPSIAWRFTAYPPQRAATTLMHEIKKHVERETGGRFSITITYGSLGSPREFLDLLKIGAIHGAVIQAALSGDRLPLYTVLDLPFLPLGDIDVHQAVHEALHKHPPILKEFAAWNAIPFMTSLIPQYELVGKGVPPAAPRDLRNVRVRAQGELGRAFGKLGAAPTTIPAPEVYTALDRGLVSAVSMPFYAIKAYRLEEVAKWMTTNLAVGTTGVPLVLNLEAWHSLPPQYKALLEEARSKAYPVQRAAIEAEQVAAYEFLKPKLNPIEFSSDALRQFREAGGRPVWDEWVKSREERGLPAREVLDLVLETASQVPGKASR